MNFLNKIKIPAVIALLLITASALSGPEVELAPWDLPEGVEFRPVKPEAKISKNPSFLPKGMKSLIVKNILRAAPGDITVTDDHIKELYIAGLRLTGSNTVTMTYMAFKLPGKKYMKEFVRARKPAALPEKRGRAVIWYNGTWYVSLTLGGNTKSVPMEFTLLDRWLSERYKNFVKFSY